MMAKAKDDKETAFLERLVIEDFRNKELGIPTLSIDKKKQRKERQRAFIEEELLKGEEEEKRATKEKVIHLYIFIILFF